MDGFVSWFDEWGFGGLLMIGSRWVRDSGAGWVQCNVLFFVGKYDRFDVVWVLLKAWGSRFCSDTKLMQDSNGEIG